MAKALLPEVSEINPKFVGTLSSNATVGFVPMAAVSESTRRIEQEQERTYREVAKGYTPFRNGDVIVAKITPCFENGKMALVDLEHEYGFGSTEFHVIRPDLSRVDPRYLFHFLGQEELRRKGQARMTGSAGQRRVPKSFYERLEILLLPLAEQRRIAAILDAADALRAKRRAALGKLDALVQAVFLEMLDADGVDRQVVMSEVIVEAQSGFASGDHDAQGIAQIRMNNVTLEGHLDFTSIRRVPQNAVKKVEKFLLRSGDVLFNSTNSANLVGKSALFYEQVEPFVFSNHFLRLVPDRNRLDSRFLAHWLSDQQRRGTFELLCTKWVNQAAVRREDLLNLRIPLPSMEAQNCYGTMRDRVESRRNAYRYHLSALDKLFSALQQRAFRGEL